MCMSAYTHINFSFEIFIKINLLLGLGYIWCQLDIELVKAGEGENNITLKVNTITIIYCSVCYYIIPVAYK